MANYSFVVGSNYDPFKFEEIAAPFMLYKNEYDKHNEEMSKLMEEASVWDGMVDEDKDPYTFARLNTFKNTLKGYSDDMAINGLNPSYRKSLMNSKADFSRRIKPIEAAFTKRAALQDEQRKAMAADKSLRYERMANEMSLDNFVLDPNADYGNSVSLNAIKDEVWAIADKASKLARNGRIPAKVLASLGIQGYGAMITENGATPEMIYQLLMNGIENSQFAPAIQSIIQKYGVGVTNDQGKQLYKGWGNTKTQQEAYGALKQGIYGWLGNQDIKPLDVKEPTNSSGRGESFTDENDVTINWFNTVFRNKDAKSLKDKEQQYNNYKIDGSNFGTTDFNGYMDTFSPFAGAASYAFPGATAKFKSANGLEKYRTINTVNGKTIKYTSDSKDKFLTKDEIIAQGVTDKDKELIKDWYEKIHKPRFKKIGIDYDTITSNNNASTMVKYNADKIKAKKNAEDPKAFMSQVARVPFDKEVLQNLFNVALSNSPTDKDDPLKRSGIGEILGVKTDGSFEFKTESNLKDDFGLTVSDNGAIKLNDKAEAYINLNGKNECLILRNINGQNLRIPLNKLGQGCVSAYRSGIEQMKKSYQKNGESLSKLVDIQDRYTSEEIDYFISVLDDELARDLKKVYSNIFKEINNYVSTEMKKSSVPTITTKNN